jgi:type IV pilus assembly protein PilM
MGKKIVGLDIGASSIKLVQLLPDGNGYSLVAVGKSLTPQSFLYSESEMDQKNFAQAVTTLFKESRATSNAVSVALLESLVATKVIEMPLLNDNELASAIKWEAEQYIPWPIDEVSLDWQVLSKSGPEVKAVDAKMQVLLVVAPTLLINKYIKILKMANLEVVSVESEVLSISRAVYLSDVSAPTTLVLDMGSNSTNVCIIENGLMIFSRTIAMGGSALTRAVSGDLNLDFNQAEEYKRTYGLDETKLSGKVAVVIKPVFDVVVNEIKRAFTFFQTLRPGGMIKRIVVSGGTGMLPGAVFYIAGQMSDVEVQIADPWKNIKFPQKLVYDPRTEGALYTTAVGLAIKDV